MTELSSPLMLIAPVFDRSLTINTADRREICGMRRPLITRPPRSARQRG
ncbi:MAG TPA: hypothetical protein VKT30_13065 [Caulobacteraceae bacterium]|nr:hypothetical protein [Caulobacteraceae bacterium]